MARIDLIEKFKKQRKLFEFIKSTWYPLIDLKWAVERFFVSRCPVCGSKRPFIRIKGYGRIFLKCAQCSLIWAHDYSRMRALIGMGMNDFGGGEPDGGGETEMFLARFCNRHFGARSVLLFGTGPTQAFRVLFAEGIDVYGSDVSLDVVKFRQAEFGNKRFLHPKQLGEKKFDLIISAEVIEHLFDPVAEINGIIQHLEPGGLFCGSTGFSRDGGVDEGPNAYMSPRGHVIYWSENSLRTAFGRLGLDLTTFSLGPGLSTSRLFFGTSNPSIASDLTQMKNDVAGGALAL